jgi:hypothetical protein
MPSYANHMPIYTSVQRPGARLRAPSCIETALAFLHQEKPGRGLRRNICLIYVHFGSDYQNLCAILRVQARLATTRGPGAGRTWQRGRSAQKRSTWRKGTGRSEPLQPVCYILIDTRSAGSQLAVYVWRTRSGGGGAVWQLQVAGAFVLRQAHFYARHRTL